MAGWRFTGPGVAAALFAALTIVLSLSPMAAAAEGDGLIETVRRIKPAIVGIGFRNPLGRPPVRLVGTGFAIGDGSLVATNNHVVMQQDEREQLVVLAGRGEKPAVITGEVVAFDAGHDVAVIRIGGPPLKPLSLGPAEFRPEGTPIAFTGYPIGAIYGLFPVTHRGIVSAITPIVIPQANPRQLSVAMIRRLQDRFRVYQLDATAYPGNSGSPLYVADSGQVLGVISSVFVKETKEKVLSDPSGITFAVPVRYLLELLKKNNL